jgi:hypothetical protein
MSEPKMLKNPLEIVHISITEHVAHAESRPELHLIVDCRENYGDAGSMMKFVIRAVNAHEALVEACRAIYKAVEANAAPINVPYALRRSDRIDLDPELLINLFAALRLAESTAPATEVRDGEDV